MRRAAEGRSNVLPRALGLIAGVSLLTVLASLEVRPRAPFVGLGPRLSVELLVALALLALLGARRPVRRWELWVGALLCSTWLLLGFAARAVPVWMGRPIDLYGDLPHVRGVAAMFLEAASSRTTLILGSLAAGFCLLVLLASWVSLRAITGAMSHGGLRRATLVVGMVAMASFLLLPAAIGSRIFTPPLIAELARSVGAAIEPGPAPLHASAGRSSNLARLRGADVVLVFLESYGVTLIEDEQHWPAIAPRFAQLDRALRQAGVHVASRVAASPTFAGGSWRAHATLMSGLRIRNQRFYDALLASERPTLAHILHDAGYRTVTAEPAIHGDWPEGRFFGFDRIYDAAALDYRDKEIGWWKIPDQYTLYKIWHDEIRDAERPVFAKVALIMTHIPYTPVAPYVEDWSRFATATAYERSIPSIAADDYRDLFELSSRYVEAFEYELDILRDFVIDVLPHDSLLIVAGDHQPPKLATHDSDSWAVPIHVLSRRADLVEPFMRFGFEPVMVPQRRDDFALEDFLPAFLGAMNDEAIPADL